MISSIHRIIIIARNTLTEAVRQKVLSVLLVFALVMVGCSIALSQIATPGLETAGLFDNQIKQVKDIGFGFIDIFGFAIAVLSTAQLLPQELHNRTIYTILAKPVRRSEFLLGKFFGVVLLLALCVSLMSIAFAAILYWEETQCLGTTQAMFQAGIKTGWQNDPAGHAEYNQTVGQILSQIRDPHLIEVFMLDFAKLVMVSAIAMLLSTFATSSIFTIITTFMLYLIGYLESTARDVWLGRGAEVNLWQSSLVGLIALLVPDMNSFTIIDETLAGNVVPWHHAFVLLGYGSVYVVVLLAVSIVIFDFREL